MLKESIRADEGNKEEENGSEQKRLFSKISIMLDDEQEAMGLFERANPEFLKGTLQGLEAEERRLFGTLGLLQGLAEDAGKEKNDEAVKFLQKNIHNLRNECERAGRMKSKLEELTKEK